MPPLPSPVGTETPHRPRIRAVDALRGLALCGILPVNIYQQLLVEHLRAEEKHSTGLLVLELGFEQRFFPIFSFLFGLSFALFLERAAARTERPRLVLLRRLLALSALGIAHQLIHPGEALLIYAFFGLVVLLPASWLPRWLVLAGGLAGILGALALAGGGIALVPPLFLLGLATARYRLPDTLDTRRPQLLVLFVLAAPAAVAASVWQYRTGNNPFGAAMPVAGLLGALAYTAGLLLLLRTRAGYLFFVVLEPLGRMALTNYVTATLAFLAFSAILGLDQEARVWALYVLAGGILAAQVTASRWWLARFRYGPLEWCWRCLTWWQRVPNRHTARRQASRTAHPRPGV